MLSEPLEAVEAESGPEGWRAGAVSPRRILFWLLPASTAMFALFNGMQSILLPRQVEMIDASNKIGNLGLVTTISAVTAVAGLLAGGAISDRTTGRWGKRTPSLLFGAAASAVLLLFLSGAASIAALVGLCAALWFCANYYQAALTAILPERIPLAHRGIGSSVLAMGIPLGVILGVNLAARTSQAAAYFALAALVVVTTACLVVFAPEPAAAAPPPSVPLERKRFAARVGRFFHSFRSGDFTLAFAARALMFFSIFCVTGYTYYILQDYVGARNLPGGDVQAGVSVMITIQMVACIASTAVSGWLADRWGRPKLFVAISSLGIAAAMMIPLFEASWPAMIVMQALVGLFFGAYMAVDLALMSLVLPDPEAEGRDMALLAVATSGSQILSPVAAAGLIAQFGYSTLFGFGGAVAIAGGVAVMYIKGVR